MDLRKSTLTFGLTIGTLLMSPAHSDAQTGPAPRTGYIPASDGINYYYEIHGQGQPLLLLHGGLFSIDLFGPSLPALARQQLDMEQRYTTMADYMRGFVKQVRTTLSSHDERLASLELRLDPQATLTEDQAAEVALAVKNVGQKLSESGLGSGKGGGQGNRNGYALVYSELYRRYGVSSYHNLSQHQHTQALAWLHQWYEELSGDK